MTQTEDQLTNALACLARRRTDEDAWRIVYNKMWPLVMATMYRHLRGARDLAEDASQDVFLRLLRYIDFGDVRDPATFKRYVRAVCLNVALDYLKRLGARMSVSLDDNLATKPELEGKVPRSPEEQVDATIRLEALMSGLGDFQQRLLRLVSDGYSLGEIAAATGLSYSNVAVRLHRLRRELAKDPRFSDLAAVHLKRVKKGPDGRS